MGGGFVKIFGEKYLKGRLWVEIFFTETRRALSLLSQESIKFAGRFYFF